MPIPRHSDELHSSQLPPRQGCDGITELRVHGVGGTPPEAILGDLAPEPVWGDGLAGFYRSADHQAAPGGSGDASRHVEAYSWGGLTARSRSRVLWLALLPFMLANLAGWMCSPQTLRSRWRFALHRAASSLGALALTVSAALLTVLITVDLPYRAVRAGLAGNQWWLAPLRWHYVLGYPARQVSLGIGAAALVVVALAALARASWRYERVRPPYPGGHLPEPRAVTAAALGGGLAHGEFWDGERSVRVFTWLHLAAFTAFLAIVMDVVGRALSGGSSARAIAVWWVALAAAAAVLAATVGYLVLDALTGTGEAPSGAGGRLLRATQALGRWHVPAWMLATAGAALACAGLFGWLQPQASPAALVAAPVSTPDIAPLVAWTAVAIAVPVALVLLSVLLGLGRGWRHTLAGGPWPTLVLGFSVLAIVALGAQAWIAHIIGPVTTDARQALAGGQVYLPYLTAYGAPLVAWAGIIAAVAFAVVEWARVLLARRLPDSLLARYARDAEEHRAGEPPRARRLIETATGPGPVNRGWQRKVAHWRMLGGATRNAGALLWAVVLLQIATAVSLWQLRWIPPLPVRVTGIAITTLLLPVLMGYLYSAWRDPARRRAIARVWDVGTFWPRSYHPLSPPCYTEQAVPDLQRRLEWLAGHKGRVLVVGHSQGAVLATAALAQDWGESQDARVALATMGSPAVKLYAWAFPAYFLDSAHFPVGERFPASLLDRLAAGGDARLVAWRNFYYPTDPIGGPMGARLLSADGAAPGGPARLEPVDVEPAGPGEGEPDPARSWYVHGTRAPQPQGHSGYWADERVWDEVNRLAARL